MDLHTGQVISSKFLIIKFCLSICCWHNFNFICKFKNSAFFLSLLFWAEILFLMALISFLSKSVITEFLLVITLSPIVWYFLYLIISGSIFKSSKWILCFLFFDKTFLSSFLLFNFLLLIFCSVNVTILELNILQLLLAILLLFKEESFDWLFIPVSPVLEGVSSVPVPDELPSLNIISSFSSFKASLLLFNIL